MLFKQILFLFVTSVLLFSCKSATKKEPESLDFLNQLPPHIEVNCHIYNKSGQQLRNYAGQFCVYEKTGDIIVANATTVTRYDSKMSPVWNKKFTFIHHQFKKSEKSNHILLIDKRIDKQKDGRVFLHDILIAMDLGGKIVKSTSATDLLKQVSKFGFTLKKNETASWLKDILDSNIQSYSENSHINSFYEIDLNSADGTQTNGYVINCFMQNLILIVSEDLKTVLRVIDTSKRVLHDVQPYKNYLIAYQNKDYRTEKIFVSTIVKFDLTHNTYSEIYDSSKKSLNTWACSSVQPLDGNFLFIFHSACLKVPEKAIVDNVVEFVNLNTGQSHHFVVKPEFYANVAYLIDATEFLKNSLSQTRISQ